MWPENASANFCFSFTAILTSLILYYNIPRKICWNEKRQKSSIQRIEKVIVLWAWANMKKTSRYFKIHLSILVCNCRRYSYIWISFFVVFFPVFWCCSWIKVCKPFSPEGHFLFCRWHYAKPACFVCLSCLCLNYNNYSHNESRCSLFTQKYLGVLSSRHLWKLVQISLLAEVNETFFWILFWLFFCLFGCCCCCFFCNAFSNFVWLKWRECLFATEYVWFFFQCKPENEILKCPT